jgi:hypothetical protein
MPIKVSSDGSRRLPNENGGYDASHGVVAMHDDGDLQYLFRRAAHCASFWLQSWV